MFDRELFGKICSVTCTFQELENFVSGINKKEFDLDNAFEKYYALDRILHAIQRYEEKEITDRFLAYWACAYNWILMAGFKTETTKTTEIAVKDVLVYEISDWLDSLSFFDEGEEWFDVNEYKEVFRALDEIYQNLAEWEFEYALTQEFRDDGYDILLLCINTKKTLYLKIFVDCYGEYRINGQDPWREEDIDKAIQSLQSNGYQEMPFGSWEE